MTPAPRIAREPGEDDQAEADLQWFRRFVAEWPWRFAKTYVESYPHEYTLARAGDAESFRRAILCIEQWGIVEPFWGAERKYFYVDDRKYWHMGNPSSGKLEEQPTLINRTWLDVRRYREEAGKFRYDEPSLHRLAERWVVLLDKAWAGQLRGALPLRSFVEVARIGPTSAAARSSAGDRGN